MSLPVLYINLDSRHDRKKRMETQCKALGIVPIRVSAVNKEQAKQATIDMRSKNNLSFGHKTSSLDIDSWGAVACFQSHRKVWQLILEEKWEKAWVLEDDAVLRRYENTEVSPEFPFVWLGLRGEPKSYPTFDYPYKVLNYDRQSFGSHAYCVHASILPALLEESISMSVDYFLNEFFYAKSMRVGLTDVAYTNEFLSFSDIDHIPIGKPKRWTWIALLLLLLLFTWYKTCLPCPFE